MSGSPEPGKSGGDVMDAHRALDCSTCEEFVRHMRAVHGWGDDDQPATPDWLNGYAQGREHVGNINWPPVKRFAGSLREAAEFAAYACLPLMPLQGSGGHYRMSPRIDPTLRATVEEWANAAHAIAELFEWLTDA